MGIRLKLEVSDDNKTVFIAVQEVFIRHSIL